LQERDKERKKERKKEDLDSKLLHHHTVVLATYLSLLLESRATYSCWYSTTRAPTSTGFNYLFSFFLARGFVFRSEKFFIAEEIRGRKKEDEFNLLLSCLSESGGSGGCCLLLLARQVSCVCEGGADEIALVVFTL